jgi:hypothetical protein
MEYEPQAARSCSSLGDLQILSENSILKCASVLLRWNYNLMFRMFIGGASLNLVSSHLNLRTDHCFFFWVSHI